MLQACLSLKVPTYLRSPSRFSSGYFCYPLAINGKHEPRVPDLGEIPIPVVILTVCAVGAVIGLVNGLVIAYLNVTPFIATMGTMIIVYGFNSLYYDGVGGSPIAGFSESFSNFAQGFFRLGSFKLSYITIYAAICAFLVWVMWNKTRFGKNIFAIGGNPEAAKVSGVNVSVTLL